MIEALTIVCVLMTGIAVGLSVVALLSMFKLRKGISINVTVAHAPIPPPISDQSPSGQIDTLQRTLDKTEEERRKTSQSLDALIGQINSIMTGGNADGQD